MDGLGTNVISADSHVNAPVEMWADYLPAEFRDRAPVLEHTDDGDFEVFEGRRKPLIGLTAAAGRRPQEYTMTVRRLDEVRRGGFDPGPRIEDQDLDGIDAEVLFGGLAGTPLTSQDPALSRASFTAYNRWLADFCAYAPTRLYGIAYVPSTDPDDTLAEVRDAAAHGLRGVLLTQKSDRGLVGRRAVGAAVGRAGGAGPARPLPRGRERRAAARGRHRSGRPGRIPQLDDGAEARDVARARHARAERGAGPPPGAEGGVGRRPDRVGPVLEGVHRPHLREAPLAPRPPLRRAAVLLHRPAGVLHVHGGPARRRRPPRVRRQPHHVGERLPALGDHVAAQPQDPRRDLRRACRSDEVQRIVHDNCAELYDLR